MLRVVAAVPKILVGGLVLGAIGVMLYGVFARYILLPITDWFDVDPVNFFWVEEVGETALAWLTLIGAAIAVGDRSHFALHVLTHRFSLRTQHAIHVFNHVLIIGFALIVAWLGYKLAVLNSVLTSPALEFSLAWLYIPAVIGGLLMAIYGVLTLRDFREHTEMDVRE
jgi:TRAP-type C4-dicarboxylate transport system permease small subunit